MYSFNWPDIFTSSRTNLLENREAAKSNLKLLLAAQKQTLFGDPYFGTTLNKYMFSQITIPFQDLIIDIIYTAIKQYVPQIRCDRNNIKLSSVGAKLTATVTYQYIFDKQVDMFSIDLIDEE